MDERSSTECPREVRWGVLGTGAIAQRFMTGLEAVPGARAVAVGSRSEAGARVFAEQWGIERRHVGKAALAADDGVDVVYIATPHADHHSSAIEMLHSGRNVLCEKPLAMNALQAGNMVEAARTSGRFLMEGMWTRFTPAMGDVLRRVEEGQIGKLMSVRAEIGWASEFDPAGRLYDPALGGGALLDVGVYPIALAMRLMGDVMVGDAEAEIALSGIDASVRIGMDGGGIRAVLDASIENDLSNRAVLFGSDGRIEIDDFYAPSGFVVHRTGGEPEAVDFPHRANGFEYEIEEVSELVRQGAVESTLMPWADSVRLAELMDGLRMQVGVAYPVAGG